MDTTEGAVPPASEQGTDLPTSGSPAVPSRRDLALALGLAALAGLIGAVAVEAALALLLLAVPLACRWLRLTEACLLLIVVFVPLEDFLTGLLPVELAAYARYAWEVLLWGLAVAVIVARLSHGRAPTLGGLAVPVALLLAVAAASAVANQVSADVAVLGLRPLLRYGAVFVLLVNLEPDLATTQRFLRAWLLVAAFVSVAGIAQAVVGTPLQEVMRPGEVRLAGEVLQTGDRQDLEGRLPVFGTLARYDLLGNYLMLTLLLAAALALGGRQLLRFRLAAVAPLYAIALVLTLSRQAWAALAIGLALLVSATGRARWLLWFGYAAAVLALVALAAPQVVRYAGSTEGVSPLERLFEPFSARYLEVNRHYYGRMFVILEIGPAIAQRAPLLGFGPGRFGSLSSRFLRSDASDLLRFSPEALRYVNDVNWITLFGQLGAAGVTAFALLLMVLFARLWRRARGHDDPLVRAVALTACAALPGWIFLGFMGPNFEVRALSFSIWLLAGLALGTRDSAAAWGA